MLGLGWARQELEDQRLLMTTKGALPFRNMLVQSSSVHFFIFITLHWHVCSVTGICVAQLPVHINMGQQQ